MDIGIIGAGWIAEKVYLPLLIKKIGSSKIHVYEVDRERARFIANKFRVNIYWDINMFFQKQLLGVIIATPNNSHSFYSDLAICNGKNVLCEKPVALSIKEYKKTCMLAKKNSLLFMPAYVNRYRNDIEHFLYLCNSGALGNVKSITGKWIRNKGVPVTRSWGGNRDVSGGGVLLDLGPHIVDICLNIANKDEFSVSRVDLQYCNEIEKYSASWFGVEKKTYGYLKNDIETSAGFIAETKEGLTLDVEVAWISNDVSGDYTYFKVQGDKRTIELNTLLGFSSDNNLKQIILRDVKGDVIKAWKYSIDLAYLAFEKMIDRFIYLSKSKKVLPNRICEYQNIEIIEKVYLYDERQRKYLRNRSGWDECKDRESRS